MSNSIDYFNILAGVSKTNTPKEEREQEENRQHKTIFDFRIKIHKWLFWFICIYIFLILALLTGNKNYFELKNPVLITLLSTTSANILGVFYIASKWLFPNKKR